MHEQLLELRRRTAMSEQWHSAIRLASEIAERYRISSIEPLITSCRKVAAQDHLSIAILGRFKAGKSSFLNHLLGRDLLPVGVIPVTTVVTEIGFGPRERAVVHFMNGQSEQVAIARIAEFIAESENPGNRKQVATVYVERPGLERLGDLRLVDMPGLESVLAHSTEASLDWLPNVGLALVAVSVDPPLTQQDIALLRNLYQYTPKVSILLAKIDLLDEKGRAEVLEFVREQLERAFGAAPPIFPYSVRSGYEQFQTQVEKNLIESTLGEFHEHRKAILERKLETLLRECGDYLRLALRSAEMIESEREALRRQVIGEKEALAQEKSELRLVVQHAAGNTRALVTKCLEEHGAELEAGLLSELEENFPNWSESLAYSLQSFEEWVRRFFSTRLSAISAEERARFFGDAGETQEAGLSRAAKLSRPSVRANGARLWHPSAHNRN